MSSTSVAEASELESTRAARSEYERHKRTQQSYLSTHERVETP